MIREWLLRKLATNKVLPYAYKGHPRPIIDNELMSTEKFSFKVFSAGGGKVIEFRSDRTMDEDAEYRLHIISDEENFADALGKIVMMELLRS